MRVWQLQEAKAKLTEVINKAKINPQIISRHGVNEIVLLNITKYEELCGNKVDIVSFFQSSPLYNLDVTFDRDQATSRNIEL
jgi:prevent-host-death family protein